MTTAAELIEYAEIVESGIAHACRKSEAIGKALRDYASLKQNEIDGAHSVKVTIAQRLSDGTVISRSAVDTSAPGSHNQFIRALELLIGALAKWHLLKRYQIETNGLGEGYARPYAVYIREHIGPANSPNALSPSNKSVLNGAVSYLLNMADPAATYHTEFSLRNQAERLAKNLRAAFPELNQ